VKLFIDESLSPSMAKRLNDTGDHDAIHPLHAGLRGKPDHVIADYCLQHDRVLVTQNADDFRRLASRAEIHPGLITLPAIDRHEAYPLILRAIAFLMDMGEVPAYAGMDVMVNHALEVDCDGSCRLYPLPPTAS
jgi:predicted nuclease of predicted toxin-antitoxin system